MKSVWFYDYPVGMIGIAEDNGGICRVFFSSEKALAGFETVETPLIQKPATQLTEYFDRKRINFDLPLALYASDFQTSIRKTLQAIPAGETRSYKDVAVIVGNPQESRAVGMANNHNPIISDMFIALINSIVGQQISTKTQATIWNRMQEQITPLTLETIGTISAQELQNCGISMRKAFYIKEIADTVLDGSLDLAHLHTMTDDEVCKRLSQIKGIGVWTAEMLMTFSMQRMDVMSWEDLAIHRGLRMLYHHRKITPELFAKYKRRYSPYATMASLYLWAIAGGACDGLVDHVPKTESQKKANAKKDMAEQKKLRERRWRNYQ